MLDIIICNKMEQVDIIRNWLNSLQTKPIPSKIVVLPIETLLDLLDHLSNNINIKNNRGKNHKIIVSGEKTTIQVYQNNVIDFFYKKQLNSNWTYIKYRDYQIKWKAVIYLYQPNTKSYLVNKKPRNNTKAKANQNQTITTKKTINTNINQFFDSLSDSE